MDKSDRSYNLKAQALSFLNAKKWEEASKVLKRLREVDPTDIHGYIEGTRVYQKLNQIDEAVRMLLEVNIPIGNSYIFEVIERIEDPELYKQAFRRIVEEKFNGQEPTLLILRMQNLFRENKPLFDKYLEMLKIYVQSGINVDYYTLLALGLIEKPDKEYLSKLFIDGNLKVITHIFLSVPKIPFKTLSLNALNQLSKDMSFTENDIKMLYSLENNINFLKTMKLFDQCKDPIIGRVYREVFFSEKKIGQQTYSEQYKPLKMALCISGQLRGYKEVFKSWKRFNFSNHEVDTYCCVWKDVGRKSIHPSHMSRLFGQHFSQAFTSFVQGMSLSAVKSLFRYLYEYMEHPVYISEKEISEFYAATKCNVVDDQEFTGKANTYKMHYMIERCWDMIENPYEYDLIFRIRPDLSLNTFSTNWNEMFKQLEDNTLIMDTGPNIHPLGLFMGDQFAASTPKIMEKYSKTFTNISNKIGVFANESYGELKPHMSLYLSMLEDNIDVICNDNIVFGGLKNAEVITSKQLSDLIELDFKDDMKNKQYFLDAIEKDFNEGKT